MTTTSLYRDIQRFYDASSGLWESIWGEHMHHGYYADGDRTKDRRQAQIDLIDELLRWADATQATEILDVGCGIGGSTLELAQRFDANATGITLSPVQAQRATARSQAAGLAQRCHFQVANAMDMPFPDSHFDLVWSLESGEHMPDKAKFVAECYRVLKPGGTLLVATWCHRPIADRPLSASERRHLEAIYRVYCLPGVISLPEYEAIARELGCINLRSADWSMAVAPFWDLVIDSALRPAAIWGLLSCGWKTVQAALSLGLMRRGYQRGLIRYGLFCAGKPGSR